MSFPRRRESSSTTPPGFRIKYGMTKVTRNLAFNMPGSKQVVINLIEH